MLFLSWLPGHGGKQQENSYLEPSHHVLAATSGTAEKFGTLLSVVRNWTPIHWQSCRAPKSHLGKVLHCPPGEGARQEFSCCFSPCPGSHVRHSTKVLLPAFRGDKTDPKILHSCRTRADLDISAALFPPGEGSRQEFSCCSVPCPGSHVRHSRKVLLPAFCGEKMEPKFLPSCRAKRKKSILRMCSTAPLEKVPGKNSLAVLYPALAAM